MRKRLIYLAALLLCLVSCGKHAENEIEYLPCQAEVGTGWGFIDKDGEVILDGRFASLPSPVSDGMFTLKNGEVYQLYRLNGQEPELLIDSLMMAGMPAFGRVPVCREAGKIEIVDKNGRSVFVLDHLDNETVVSAALEYVSGYLKIETVNSIGIHHMALVDPNGKTVLPPRYTDLLVLDEDLIWVMQETVDNSQNDTTSEVRRTAYFVDKKGKMHTDKPRTITDPQKAVEQYGKTPDFPATSNGWAIRYVDGFGYVGSHDLEMTVLNPETWESTGRVVFRIAWDRDEDEPQCVSSDTYAYDRTAKAIAQAFYEGLHSRGLTLPVAAPYVTAILERPAEEYNSFATSYTILWQEQDFQVEVVAQFDTTIIRKRFKIEHKATENMYGQPVEMNKKKDDGYEYNPEADMISVDMTCLVDSSHTDIVMQKVTKLINQQFNKRDDAYVDGEQIFRLSSKPGRIIFHLERDPKALAAKQAKSDSDTLVVAQGKYDAAIDSAMQATDKQNDSIKQPNKSQQQ